MAILYSTPLSNEFVKKWEIIVFPWRCVNVASKHVANLSPEIDTHVTGTPTRHAKIEANHVFDIQRYPRYGMHNPAF